MSDTGQPLQVRASEEYARFQLTEFYNHARAAINVWEANEVDERVLLDELFAIFCRFKVYLADGRNDPPV